MLKQEWIASWHVLRYPATRNKWKFGRNAQQLPHFWPQHATIRKISAATCNNRFRQQIRKCGNKYPLEIPQYAPKPCRNLLLQNCDSFSHFLAQVILVGKLSAFATSKILAYFLTLRSFLPLFKQMSGSKLKNGQESSL